MDNKLQIKYIKNEDIVDFDAISLFNDDALYYKNYIFAATRELTDEEKIAFGKFYCEVLNCESCYRVEIKVMSPDKFEKVLGYPYLIEKRGNKYKISVC